MKHPLRHSVINVVRKVADSDGAGISPSPSPETYNPLVNADSSQVDASSSSAATPPTLTNGVDYLLTNLTLFTTHEPCIMCSMALVHSRVQRVFYIYSMPKTGGCGGCCAIVGLDGVNHRYDAYRWVGGLEGQRERRKEDDIGEIADA